MTRYIDRLFSELFPMSLPIVIAHRGASGHRPEHTLAAYQLAIDLGADFIEPDLVSTRDHVLVARHENAIATVDVRGELVEATTDVPYRPEFADRLTEKSVDGRTLRGWFTEDFTLEELRTLRAVERMPDLRTTAYDRVFEVATLDEILELARRGGERRGRPVGVYPETKHPGYFQSIGLPLEQKLIAALENHRFGGPDAPAFIQSFETSNLRMMKALTPIPLVQLLADEGAPHDLIRAGDSRTYRELIDENGLATIASYARAIGPSKHLIIPRDNEDKLGSPTTLIADAHAAGLLVHAWTFRDENRFLPVELRREGQTFGDGVEECAIFFALGVDGLFTDHPATAIEARDRTKIKTRM